MLSQIIVLILGSENDRLSIISISVHNINFDLEKYLAQISRVPQFCDPISRTFIELLRYFSNSKE